MLSFIFRRLIQACIVLLGVGTVAFAFVHLSGDPASVIAGPDAPLEEVELLRKQMGFDKPIMVQYVSYLGRVVRGDFGPSFLYRQSAFSLLLERVPLTAILATAALGVNLVQSLPIGILSAIKPGSIVDHMGTAYVFGAQSVPVFWSGIIGILIFAVWLGILPSSGYGTIAHLVLPAVALGINTAAYQTRLLRSALLEVIGEDYIRTARAKGLAERRVVIRHALKNALIPFVAATATQFSVLVGGAVILETVFDWPGLGRLVVQAIYNRDVNMVVAATMLLATFVVIVNVFADILYGFLDPRIRFQ